MFVYVYCSESESLSKLLNFYFKAGFQSHWCLTGFFRSL